MVDVVCLEISNFMTIYGLIDINLKGGGFFFGRGILQSSVLYFDLLKLIVLFICFLMAWAKI